MVLPNGSHLKNEFELTLSPISALSQKKLRLGRIWFLRYLHIKKSHLPDINALCYSFAKCFGSLTSFSWQSQSFSEITSRYRMGKPPFRRLFSSELRIPLATSLAVPSPPHATINFRPLSAAFFANVIPSPCFFVKDT